MMNFFMKNIAGSILDFVKETAENFTTKYKDRMIEKKEFYEYM